LREDDGIAGADPVSPAWNLAAALERVEGDRELVDELAHLFAEECPKAMDEIRSAIDQKDAGLLERGAHTMKGSSGNIGAVQTSELALALESLARSGNLEKAKEQFRLLEAEIARLLRELETLSPKLEG
jgi:two-component system, sensor histidine kinase and response regulator